MTSKEAMELSLSKRIKELHTDAVTREQVWREAWQACEQFYRELAPEFEYFHEQWVRANGSRSPSIKTALQWQFDQLKAWAGSVKSENERLRELLETATCECTIAERVSGHRVACHMPEIQEALKPKEVSGE